MRKLNLQLAVSLIVILAIGFSYNYFHSKAKRFERSLSSIQHGLRDVRSQLETQEGIKESMREADDSLEKQDLMLARLEKIEEFVSSANNRFDEVEDAFIQVLGFFDSVDMFYKNGHFENYGAAIRQRRVGPLEVTYTEALLEKNSFAVLWNPAFSPADDATHIVLELTEVFPESGTAFIGVETSDGKRFRFSYHFGGQQAHEPLYGDELPSDMTEAIHGESSEVALLSRGNPLFAALPENLRATLRNNIDGHKVIRSWLFAAEDIPSSKLLVRRLFMARKSPRDMKQELSLSGQVIGGTPPVGTTIDDRV